jgi:ABC-type spermidine/putrescine transport system permease subunit II
MGGYQTLPTRIDNHLSDRVAPTVAADSALPILMSLGLILVLDRTGGLKMFEK